MRIVGGKLRGRTIAEPKSQNIRPTTDRVRESLYNIISHRWPERLAEGRVLDLFAGTGALGIEALSRGAAFAFFVDNSVEGRSLLRANIENLGLAGSSKISKTDAAHLGPVGKLKPFSLVFADPPYGKGLGERALVSALDGGWIEKDALIVLEEQKGSLPASIPNFTHLESRSFGGTEIGFFNPVTAT